MKSMTSGKFGNINKTNWKQMDNGELISYYKSSCFKKMLNKSVFSTWQYFKKDFLYHRGSF